MKQRITLKVVWVEKRPGPSSYTQNTAVWPAALTPPPLKNTKVSSTEPTDFISLHHWDHILKCCLLLWARLVHPGSGEILLHGERRSTQRSCSSGVGENRCYPRPHLLQELGQVTDRQPCSGGVRGLTCIWFLFICPGNKTGLKMFFTFFFFLLLQLLPIIDLVRGVPCAVTKRRHLRKALLQYLEEFDTCKCSPCPNNARPVLSGTECKCACQTGTYGTNCEKRAPDFTSGRVRQKWLN